MTTATHVHCHEDDSYTELPADSDPADFPCAECEEVGREDPYCVSPVIITPCPQGVTRADWLADYPNGRCDDEDHEPKTGNHVEDLDL